MTANLGKTYSESKIGAIFGKKIGNLFVFAVKIKNNKYHEQETVSFLCEQETLRRVRRHCRILRFGSHAYQVVVGRDDAVHGGFPWRVGLHHQRHHCATAESIAESVVNRPHPIGSQRNAPAPILRARP